MSISGGFKFAFGWLLFKLFLATCFVGCLGLCAVAGKRQEERERQDTELQQAMQKAHLALKREERREARKQARIERQKQRSKRRWTR